MKRQLGFILAGLLLAAFLIQAVSTLSMTAPTYDEVAHIAAGYAALTTGRYHLNREHPPLVKLLAALPLLSIGGRVEAFDPSWPATDEWTFGRRFLFGPERPTARLLWWSRLPMIALGLLGAVAVYVWALNLYGQAGGLGALALYSFSPTLLAHTRLVTTDVAVGVFGLMSCYCCWRLMKQPTPLWAAMTGLALGSALAAKYSALLLVPALLLAVGWVLWSRRLGGLKRAGGNPSSRVKTTGPNLRSLCLLAGVILLSALSVVGFSYGFPPSLTPYLKGMRLIGFNHAEGYLFYLLGQFDVDGFFYYFPAAFLLKTSPAVLLAGALAVGLLIWRGSAVSPSETSPGEVSEVSHRPFLFLPPLIYLLTIMAFAPEIGLRYILPLYPFLFVSLGWLPGALSRRIAPWVLTGLFLLHVHAALVAHPDPISYFNGLLGCQGPQAIRCLDDSNLDWGQDLGRIAAVVDPLRDGEEEIGFLYFGTADPAAYLSGIRSMQFSEMVQPKPQIYVLSVHHLNRWNRVIKERTGLDWFARFEPLTSVGNTYLVYDLRKGKVRSVLSSSPG
ncbi:MAG: glycosyltransferase family 39 protein [Acidobacteriota bacterium]